MLLSLQCGLVWDRCGIQSQGGDVRCIGYDSVCLSVLVGSTYWLRAPEYAERFMSMELSEFFWHAGVVRVLKESCMCYVLALLCQELVCGRTPLALAKLGGG